MCQKCANPESPEGKKIREYFQSRGKTYTDAEIAKKTKHLLSLSDPFIVGNDHFTPELDAMPDGIHAKTRYKWKKVFSGRAFLRKTSARNVKQDCHQLEEEYKALPEPKPEYLEWASTRSRPRLFEELYRQATSAPQGLARVKAISTILEFTKSKPKQELEVTQGVQSGELPDLFQQLCQLGGVPKDASDTFIETYFGKSPQTN